MDSSHVLGIVCAAAGCRGVLELGIDQAAHHFDASMIARVPGKAIDIER
jgi:hypothetical protein